MRQSLLLVATLACISGPAAAADLTVSVKGDDGQPLPDAVVVVRPAAGGPAAQAIRFAWPLTMTQQDISFNPYVLIVPVGSTVGFPNRDKVRHHVYSFSATKKFELKLYGRQEERTVTFERAGIVPLGCNIHDRMIGYVFVTDSPFTAKTNAAGEAVVRGLPAGAATVSTWHPEMKARAPVTAPMSAGGRQAVVLAMKPAAMRRGV